MSVTYNIACNDCKKYLWIGQSNYIYTSDRVMEALREFLFGHVGHELIFEPLDFGYFDGDEWKEINVFHGDEVTK